MGLPIGIPDLIAGIFKPAAELIDELHTSKEEKLDAQTRLLEVQAAVMHTAFEYERSTFEQRAKIIQAEAGSDSWLASSWRPLLMVTFGTLVVARFLGFEAPAMGESEYTQMWGLLKIGIGGYIAARSTEKIVKTIKKAPE